MNIVMKVGRVIKLIPKYLYLKYRYGKRFNSSIMQDWCPTSKFVLGEHGTVLVHDYVHLKNGVEIWAADHGNVTLGGHTCVNSNTHISAMKLIEIGEGTEIAQNCVIIDHDHDFKSKNGLSDQVYNSKPIIIGKNVWIGANSVILKGTILHDGCVVGAGCVVCGREYESNSIITQKRETTVRIYTRDCVE